MSFSVIRKIIGLLGYLTTLICYINYNSFNNSYGDDKKNVNRSWQKTRERLSR